MFLSRNKKNNVYPCKPHFYNIKVGFKGSNLYRYVFVMSSSAPFELASSEFYEGVSINNLPIPFPMDRDGHDFHSLFQYMFYTWVQNCTRVESFFNKILNVKNG